MQELKFSSATQKWYRPTSLHQLIKLQAEHQSIKYVGGGTGNYKVHKLHNDQGVALIDLTEVTELKFYTDEEYHWEFGAGLRLSEMQHIFDEMEVEKNPVAAAFKDVLSRLASTQIRNTATIGGALLWPHSCSDMMLLCSALKCTLVIVSPDGSHNEINMDETFFPSRILEIATKQSIIKSLRIKKLNTGKGRH